MKRFILLRSSAGSLMIADTILPIVKRYPNVVRILLYKTYDGDNTWTRTTNAPLDLCIGTMKIIKECDRIEDIIEDFIEELL